MPREPALTQLNLVVRDMAGRGHPPRAAGDVP